MSLLHLALGGIALVGLGAGLGYLGKHLIDRNINTPGRIGVNLENNDNDRQIERFYLCFDQNNDGNYDLTRIYEWRNPSAKNYEGECESWEKPRPPLPSY